MFDTVLSVAVNHSETRHLLPVSKCQPFTSELCSSGSLSLNIDGLVTFPAHFLDGPGHLLVV